MDDGKQIFEIDPLRSSLVVRATSPVHDTEAKALGISGRIELSGSNLGKVKAQLSVPMGKLDAGDFLKNRKLKKDLELQNNPDATFGLQTVALNSGAIDELLTSPRSTHTLSATLVGTLKWRGTTIELSSPVEATFEEAKLRASASFAINMSAFGIKAPRILMIKVADLVECRVELLARRA